MSSKEPRWMDDDDELYKASVYIRRKLEAIEQNAAPDVDDRQLQREADRSRRLHRRQQLKDVSVQAQVVPYRLADAVACGLVPSEPVRLPVRVAVMDVSAALEACVLPAPAAAACVHDGPISRREKDESNVEVLYDLKDAVKFMEQEVMETSRIRIIDVDSVSADPKIKRELALPRSRSPSPTSAATGKAKSSHASKFRDVANEISSDEDAAVASPWSKRHAHISALAFALKDAERPRGAAARAVASSHVPETVASSSSARCAVESPGSIITTRRKARTAPQGLNADVVCAPPFRELSVAATANRGGATAPKDELAMQEKLANFWRCYEDGNPGTPFNSSKPRPRAASLLSTGDKRSRGQRDRWSAYADAGAPPPAWANDAVKHPWFSKPEKCDDYDNYIPMCAPNLKAINERSYVNGYSIKKAWAATSGVSSIQDIAFSPSPRAKRHPRPSDFFLAQAPAGTRSFRDDFVYDIPKVRSKVVLPASTTAAPRPLKKPAPPSEPSTQVNDRGKRPAPPPETVISEENKPLGPPISASSALGALLEELAVDQWPKPPGGKVFRVSMKLRDVDGDLPVAGAIIYEGAPPVAPAARVSPSPVRHSARRAAAAAPGSPDASGVIHRIISFFSPP